MPVREVGSSSVPEEWPCFEATASETSDLASGVFEDRGLQPGGPSWAAVIRVLVGRHGESQEMSQPPPGYPGFGVPYELNTSSGTERYVIDDEGDAAIFCAQAPAFLEAIRTEWETVNESEPELARALDEADPAELE